MASVTYSNAKKYRHLGQDEEEPEQSQKEILRQKILKELSQKQLSKQVSLEQQLHNQKKFVRAAHEEAAAASTSGLTSFEDFKSVESVLNVKQTLKSCGLTDSEIQLLIDGESQNYLQTPQARRQRLEAIEDKLVQHRGHLEVSHQPPDQAPRGDFELSCHQEEAQRVPLPEEVQEPPAPQDCLPHGHPMNYLKEIAEKLFPSDKSDQSYGEESFGKKREHCNSQGQTKPKRDRKETSSCVYLTEKPKTYWDLQQIPKVIGGACKPPRGPFPLPPGKGLTSTTSDRDKIIVHTTKNTPVTIDHTKPFIMSLDPEDLIPLATIETNRKSIQELKDLDKFKNYNEGTPSRTLFIKNLSPSVSPKQLASLMGHFESSHGPKILYRILGGRMKGQAFVTFPDEAAASKALTLCTGYLLHGRPLVAVFGKRS
ncbi:RNA-binding protein 41 [Chionoecetes opilio]|uniref:RNA-binding protein 41 n=1 Tax=Chionoecetes opilio TaxID=41210 RepID=A0A8J4Y5S0_CHIOP|nr:RNA-binding protein 41 [Chionoecetes opilio]